MNNGLLTVNEPTENKGSGMNGTTNFRTAKTVRMDGTPKITAVLM